MSTERVGRFIQFPLALLSLPENWATMAFRWGVVHYIDSKAEGVEPAFATADSSTRERQFDRARDVIGFDGGSPADYLRDWQAAQKHVALIEARYGSGAALCQIRLRADLYWDWRAETIPDAHLRLFCAALSVLGVKDYAKIGWPMFQARAFGFTAPVESPPPGWFSRQKIDRTLADLQDRGLLVSVTYNRGERFWSSRLSREELAERVKTRKVKSAVKRAQRAAADSLLSDEIRRARGLINVPTSLINVPTPCPAPARVSTPEHMASTPPSTSPSR